MRYKIHNTLSFLFLEIINNVIGNTEYHAHVFNTLNTKIMLMYDMIFKSSILPDTGSVNELKIILESNFTNKRVMTNKIELRTIDT